MSPRLLLPWLLLAAVGCSSGEVASKCGPNTPPLPEGSSVPVQVEELEGRLDPVNVDGGLYGAVDEFPSVRPSPAPPSAQPGSVRKRDGRLVLTTEDGRSILLTQYVCD